jgi:hypothetical protein
VLFVKLRQFAPEDLAPVRIPTGFRPMALYSRPDEEVRLERWEPGAQLDVAAPAGLELLVLQGSFEEGGERFARHSWLRLPPGSALRARAGTEGARVWAKSGHLLAKSLRRW